MKHSWMHRVTVDFTPACLPACLHARLPACHSSLAHTLASRLSNEKLTKLRSPNFTVSTTRLAVHNVPKDMSERELKELFIRAVKQRATKQQPVIKQVREGLCT